MSEVKRYAESCMEGGGVVESKNGELVDFSAYEAAQSELAALREELANLRLQCGGMEMTIDEQCQALTAAEQRNAELVEILRSLRLNADPALFSPGQFAQVDAALNPIESGSKP